MPSAPDPPAPDTIGTLQALVTTAARLADTLVTDPLLSRMIDLFARMPPEDRQPILAILEREVDLRNLGRAAKGGPLAGINPTRVNPNARLYLRATDGGPPAYVSHEEIAAAMLRAAQVMHRAFQRSDDLAAIWEPAVLAGLREVAAEERESLLMLHRRIVELIETVAPERR